MAVTADKVIVQLQAETAQYQQGMRTAEAAAARFDLKSTTAIGNVGNAFTGLGQGVVKSSAQAEASLARMSERTVREATKQKAALDDLIRKHLEYGRTTAIVPGGLPGLGGQSWGGGGAAPFAPIKTGADQANTSVNKLGGSVGNIAAQLNDIGTTAAMGMNPLLIALQQGTQLSQVFAGQKLGDVAKGLAGAFASVVSPVSLLTIGLVAAVAALGQWVVSALTASSDTEKFGKSLDNLNKQVDALKGYVELATSPLEKLQEQFGENAERAREVYTALAALQSLKAMDAISSAMEAANDQLGGLEDRLLRIDQVSGTGQGAAVIARQVRLLNEEFGLTEAQARIVKQRMDELAQAQGPYELAQASAALANALVEARNSGAELPDNIRDLAIQLGEASIQGLALEKNTLDAKAAADALAAAGPGGGWLSGAIGAASTLATKLWEAAQARAAAEGNEWQPVPAPNGGRPPPRAPAELGIPDPDTGGGTSGVARAQERFDDRILKEIEGLKAETEALNALSLGFDDYGNSVAAARKEAEMLQDLQNKGVPLTNEMRDAVHGLAMQWQAAADAQQQAKERHAQFQSDLASAKSSMESAFTGLITGAHSFRDALSGVLMKLAEIAASRAFETIWSGGLGKTTSSFLGGLFGFSSGGYTGPGSVNQPAGVVHKGEVVWSQADIARAGGVGVVEGMRRGLRGYAGGGMVGMPDPIGADPRVVYVPQPYVANLQASDDGQMIATFKRVAGAEVEARQGGIIRQSVAATNRAMQSTKAFGSV